MLHRCAATSACCPKLSEEDVVGMGLGPAGRGTQFYSNPFMHEEHPQLHFSMGGDDEGSDFPPGALALMYDPPIDDELELDGGSDEWNSDVNSAMPKLMGNESALPLKRSGPMGPQLRTGPQPQPQLRSGDRAPESRFGPEIKKPVSPEIKGSLATSERPVAVRRSEAQGQSAPSELVAYAANRLSPARAASPGKPRGLPSHGDRPVAATPEGRGAHGSTTPHTAFGPPGRKPDGENNVPEKTLVQSVQQPRTQSRSLMQPSTRNLSSDQPRTFSRSVRDAQACTSEAGAASIAAILQCVEQADEIPVQQRPNSGKWSERWNGYSFDRNKDK
eukprot:TRINITY_DN41380_c0_g1_i1.p1 TRINITY_DN41380_c0_g1~~TRINITY_DN41380_c0_g1_i1.p1  ORF type:complete len:332 (-),score=45.33 TRINITY_DN41380_c0_g1_i1:37-1032(-)